MAPYPEFPQFQTGCAIATKPRCLYDTRKVRRTKKGTKGTKAPPKGPLRCAMFRRDNLLHAYAGTRTKVTLQIPGRPLLPRVSFVTTYPSHKPNHRDDVEDQGHISDVEAISMYGMCELEDSWRLW